MANPALELSGAGKRYGKRAALDNVSIMVEAGECYGLAGPNGAGKTTLIRLLLGLLEPDAGEVRLFGERPSDNPEVRRRLGFVPEAAELPPSASPRALMRRFAWLRGLAVAAAEEQGVFQLERLGMAGLLDRPAGRLSKGEKQRTLLALALLGEPELLVLDEPTDGLDPLGRALVRRVLHEERAAGRTVFLNSHLLAETEKICTRVGILHKGRLVREERLGEGDLRERETTAVTLAGEIPQALLERVGARRAAGEGGREGVAGQGETVLLEHGGAVELNEALDRLRAGGALLLEVRPARPDLEAAFALAVAGEGASTSFASAGSPASRPVSALVPDSLASSEPPARAQVPGLAPARRGLLRPARAALRVTREIALDLASRKIGWMALVLALLIVAGGLWSLHADVVVGFAALVRHFANDGLAPGSLAPITVAHLVGRQFGTIAYWLMLAGSVALSALFAPPLLDPRRTILLLAQPISRQDLVAGIFLAVCALALGTFLFLELLLFGGVRALGISLSLQFLLLPLPLLLSFASLYSVVLCATYAVRSALFAAIIGAVSLFGLITLGESGAAQLGGPLDFNAVAYGLLPKVTALGEQAARLGGGGGIALFPFLSTLAFLVAMLAVLTVAARRSER